MSKTTLGVTMQGGWGQASPVSFAMVGDSGVDDTAFFTGSVSNSVPSIGTIMGKANFTSGTPLFPQSRKSFIVSNDMNAAPVRVDVTPQGELIYMGGLPSGARLYLDGISFVLGA